VILKVYRKFPWWSWILPLTVVAAGLSSLFLVQDASNAILESADGTFEEVVLDPLAPGYESYVLSTPTHLVAIEGESGLASVVLVSLFSDDRGGSALVFPVELIISGERSVGEVFAGSSESDFLSDFGSYLGIGFDTFSILNEDFLEYYFSVAGPLTVLSDDPLRKYVDGEAITVYEAGQIVLTANEVSNYLSWVNQGESPYNRWLRTKNFWNAWLESLTDTEIAIFNEMEDQGELTRIMKGLSIGELFMPDLNIFEGKDSEGYLEIDIVSLKSVIFEIVPFPIAPFEGGRAEVKLIDGVGGVDLVNRFVPSLVASGAEIKLVGNALEFGVRESNVTYYDVAFSEFADNFAIALGGATVEFEPLSESAVDITVLIGLSSID
jgi:hypothetical protein|tara:strand:- start:5717 stop:6859 length:1143 start_codon:yes stop_codon:yes gene_type:complete